MNLLSNSLLATLALLSASLTSVSASTANVYYYTASTCGGSAYDSNTFTAYSGCVNLGSGAASLGLHRQHVGDEGVTCSVYTSTDCSGKEEGFGIGKSQDWGCTDSNMGWLHSMKCYQGQNS